MNHKPSDLFLSVIDFFGVLIPGAVFTFLHGDFLLRPLGLSVGSLQSLTNWVPAFCTSFVLGHFLLGFGVPLNKIATRFLGKDTLAYFNAVHTDLKLPPDVSVNKTNVFYSACSFIRIHSSEAMAELERQVAEYKLFRSLTLLFLLDIPLSALSDSYSLPRLVISVLIVCLAAYRFSTLSDWAYRLAFDFYLQLQKPATGGS